MSAGRTQRFSGAMPWFLLVAIVLFALNLRGPIVALAPVLESLRIDLGVSAPAAGLLTSVPVLCFALATPLAAALIARSGAERSVLISLVGIMVGTLVRSAGGFELAVVGTVILGIAITIGNVVVPVVVRRDFPAKRVGIVTGIYTASLNVGAMLTSLATAPLADLFGWRVAVSSWAVLVVVAIVVWGSAAGWRRSLLGDGGLDATQGESPDNGASTGVASTTVAPTDDTPTDDAAPKVRHRASWTSLTSWILTAAFAGQAFGYYGLTAWLPTILHDLENLDVKAAGASSSLFQVMAVIGALGAPVLAARWRPASVIALISALWITMPLGLMLAPSLWSLWSILGGAAQGGGITLIFIIIVRMASSNDQARGLSAFVQGGGYAVAATGPSIIGAVHELSGGWTAPLAVVTCAVLVLAGCGVWAANRAEARHPAS